MITKEDRYAEAYRRGILPEDKKARYEEAVRRGLMSNPELRAQLLGTDSADKKQETSIADQSLLGLQESARAGVTAAASIVDIIPEIGDAFVSAAVWAAHQVGVGDGTYTPAARVKGYLPDELKPQTEAGRLVAEIIPYFASPGSKVSTVAGKAASLGERILSRTATSASQNVVGSLASADKPDESFGVTLAENMLVGEIFRNTGKLLGLGYRAVKGTPDAAMKELVELGEQHGVKLMTTDVIQPKTAIGKMLRGYGEQIPLAGTGGMRAAQAESRNTLVSSLDAEPGAKEVFASLQRRGDMIKEAAGKRFQKIEADMGAGAVNTDLTIKALDDVIDELTRPGVARDEVSISALQKFKDDFTAAPQTFELLKTNRTSFKDSIKGDRLALPQNIDRLNQKVYSAMYADLNKAVRTRLGDTSSRKWREGNAIYADEIEKIKNTRLKNILNKGELTPESALDMFFSKKPSESKILFSSLDTKGKDAIRREMINRALAKATDFEKNIISTNRFTSEMQKMSNQMDIAFKGKDAQEVIGIVKLLNATRQAQDAALNPATGARAVPIVAALFGGSMAGILPTIAAGLSYGLSARAYESQAMRNALMKLAGTEAGSTGFEKALKEVVDAVSAAAKGSMQAEEPRITITKGYNK